jgi:hypothetical protein
MTWMKRRSAAKLPGIAKEYCGLDDRGVSDDVSLYLRARCATRCFSMLRVKQIPTGILCA